METVTRRDAQQKQKSEPAAGRRKGPEAVTELVRNGTGRHTEEQCCSCFLAMPFPGEPYPHFSRLTSGQRAASRSRHRMSSTRRGHAQERTTRA